MDDAPTCGEGIAAHAALPAKLADLMTGMADTLAAHRRALDLSDSAGQQEDDAYATLIAEEAEIAALLKSAAQRMEGYRTLPMAVHDERTMNDSATLAPYARYVGLQRELLDMLRESIEEGESMLGGYGPRT